VEISPARKRMVISPKPEVELVVDYWSPVRIAGTYRVVKSDIFAHRGRWLMVKGTEFPPEDQCVIV